jgi:type I restriction enzyme R subunit
MPFSESDTRANFIDPLLNECGWKVENIQREYYFTDGRKILNNKRGKRKFVDYLLKHRNVNLAILEAKSSDKHPTQGLQQAIDYASDLNVRFVYSSNGLKHYEFNTSTGKGDYVDRFPSPDDLFKRVMAGTTKEQERLVVQPLDNSGSNQPRYYQINAVNKAIEAISEGKKRILLTLATGTGKTFIAYQIVYKLFQTRWNLDGADRRPKVLFLADRNILADQAINTFNPFDKDLVKINGEEVRRRNGIVPTNANIFFAIYQAIAERENIGGYYHKYPKDFFDLIIVDECHRGSANEEGSWRAILDYFSSAVQLGMTATPKRNDNVDTYQYFGNPVYEYSLKQGIEDGFLTPYKVKRITTNIDEYIVSKEDRVVEGEHQQAVYELTDFERKIIIPARTELIAKTILEHISPMDKSIVFCVDQKHALTMRDMINKYKSIADKHYCVRITSDEGEIGKQLLERFRDNDKDIPVVCTTSQMLTTGVDARNVRNIILVRNILSMVEFKQIIGRGTRLFEGKDYFTIIDFTGASNLFYDPKWDGIVEIEEEPIDVTGEGGTVQEPKPRPPQPPLPPPPPPPPPPPKVVVELSNGRKLKITNVEVRYVGADGKPLTAKEFLEKLIGFIPELYSNEEDFRRLWANPDTREQILQQLEQEGFDSEQLGTLREMLSANDCDIFDVIAYLTYSSEMLTRHQRVEIAESDRFFEIFQNVKAKDFLHFVLKRYEKDDIQELRRDKISELIKLNNMGTPVEAAHVFGGADKLIEAFYKLQETLYRAI